MLVKLDVAVEFRIVFATSTSIFFSSFRCYANLLLLFRQFLRFLLELVLDLKLMLSQMITFLCSLCLLISTASRNMN